jgi:hypothetical protein
MRFHPLSPPPGLHGQLHRCRELPHIGVDNSLQHDTQPGDGVWFLDSFTGSRAAVQPPGGGGAADPPETVTELRAKGGHLTATYQSAQSSDTVSVDLTANGRTLETVIGLRGDPAVAEEIISSLRPSRTLPPGASPALRR